MEDYNAKDTVWYKNKLKYIREWNKKHTRRYNLTLNANHDQDIIDYLDKFDNFAQEMKRLIRDEINRAK